jgi:ribonuclease VapC
LIVLDASAVLAVLQRERGQERVVEVLHDAIISAVNLAEVATKLTEKGWSADQVQDLLAPFMVLSVDFSAPQAIRAGLLRAATRRFGLSTGDRCCLALAMERSVGVMTADRAWAGLDLGIPIEVIR